MICSIERQRMVEMDAISYRPYSAVQIDGFIADAIEAESFIANGMVHLGNPPVEKYGASLFHPSYNIDTAFWAAGQIELFQEALNPDFRCLMWSEDGYWQVIDAQPENRDNIIEVISTGCSPAVAICKAILALKAKR